MTNIHHVYFESVQKPDKINRSHVETEMCLAKMCIHNFSLKVFFNYGCDSGAANLSLNGFLLPCQHSLPYTVHRVRAGVQHRTILLRILRYMEDNQHIPAMLMNVT